MVTPTDVSPVPTTDPTYAAKQQVWGSTFWGSKTSISQGDGSLASNEQFVPVPLLRPSILALLPPNYSSSTLVSQIRVAKQTVANALGDVDIAQIELVYDADNDGIFTPESTFGGIPPVDQVIATTTFVAGVATFANLHEVISPLQSKNYFLAVRIASTTVTALPANLGIKVTDPTQVTVNGLGVASNNFAIFTSTSPVIRAPAVINVQGQDIAAWWNPGSGLVQYSTVTQGATSVGMLRLAFWTRRLPRLRGTKSAYADRAPDRTFDITGVKIYADANGNGTLEPASDTLISAVTPFVNRSNT